MKYDTALLKTALIALAVAAVSSGVPWVIAAVMEVVK